MSKDSSILLVGLGAIGSVMLARFNKKKYTVTCLSTEKGTKLIQNQGLSVKLADEEIPQLQNCEIYSILPEDMEFDICIITAKSWANREIVEEIGSNLSFNSSILLFQNGIKIEEPFLKNDNQFIVTRALTSLAAIREKENLAVEANIGETRIGGVNHQNDQVIKFWNNILTDIGLNIKISNDILKDIWLKSIVNCAVLPLGAITGLKNGEIIQDRILNTIIHNIIYEILTTIKDEIAITFDEAYDLVDAIVKQTSDHKCSMLQDIEKGVKTEIDTLNRKIVEIGREKNIATPINRKLTEIIKQMSEESMPRELAIIELRTLT
ncbi:MAG: ketopantoate reductase family protein [Asgard group archaeon]|nr:ketopantoate reductase family protein [Asgard group archaeon]